MTSLLLMLTLQASRPSAAVPWIIPRPLTAHVLGDAPFRVGGPITISRPAALAFEANTIAGYLRNCGAQVRWTTGPGRAADIAFEPANPTLPEGGYRLEVRSNRIRIESTGGAGAFYAVQSLRQMLPAEIERGRVSGSSIPAVEIGDQPKFPWRGVLLDVSRHFFTPNEIKRTLDLMAMQKLNVFHWHLTDDGGWRIQIKRYPKLTEQGAWRRASKDVWDYMHLEFPPAGSSVPRYGGFYTQDQIRDIVRYAAQRHIMIVPEIEMPGHCMAAVATFPDLSCNVPQADYFKATGGLPIKGAYCPGKDSTFEFLQNVLDEVFELFPSKVVHIGGDEVDKYLWNHCPDCQKRMKDEGLKDAEELQSYFVKRMERYINSKGRSLMGWDEILQGGLAPNAMVMSWRGIEGGIKAAAANHSVVMTPTSHCYFDYTYGQISTDHVLTFHPIPKQIEGTPAESQILGGQANLWTEYVPDFKTAQQRLFPRLLAMSDVLWSGESDKQSFDPRLDAFYPRLQALGLNFYLPKPEAEFDAVMMDPDAKIAFKPSPIPGAIVRYTTDGTEPNAKSKVYSGPLSAAVPQTVLAATFLPGGQSSEATRVEVASQTVDTIDGLKPGLAWSAYEGTWAKMPDFATLLPSASGETANIDLVGGKEENYALSLNGVLTVPEAGIYTFYLSSDDGSMFWLGGARVVNNDGLHGAIEQSGRIYLKAGSYPVRVGFFQAGGAQSLKLQVEGPNLAKQPVPDAWLRH